MYETKLVPGHRTYRNLQRYERLLSNGERRYLSIARSFDTVALQQNPDSGLELRRFQSPKEAQEHLDALVGEWKNEGFELTAGHHDDAPPEERHPELEELLRQHPTSPEPSLVYADWLQSRGDPRGELLAIEHALSPRRSPFPRVTTPAERRALASRNDESEGVDIEYERLLEQQALLLRRYGARLSGLLPKELEEIARSWHLGFVRRIELAPKDFNRWKIPLLTLYRRHPACTFVTELSATLPYRAGTDAEWRWLRDEFIDGSPPLPLRALHLHWNNRNSDDQVSCDWIWQRGRELDELSLDIRNVSLGEIHAPRVKTLRLGFLMLANPDAVEALCSAQWPALTELQLERESEYSELSFAFLNRMSMPQLRHLAFLNQCNYINGFLSNIIKFDRLPQLESLKFRFPWEEIAIAMERNAALFRHLTIRFERLWRSNPAWDFPNPVYLDRIKAICREVVVDGD